jgi:AcrR family transcriptional regulator
MKTDRQTQILEISMELIANKGIQGFTIKNLSKAIGISEPAIYRHFDSKTDILIAILDNFKEMFGMMSSLPKDMETTAMDKVEFLFLKLIDIFTEKPAIISVIFSEEIFKNEIILKNKIIEIQNLNQSKIEAFIEKGQANNNVRNDIDKSTLALTFMGAFRLLVKRWDLNGHKSNLKLEGKKLINSFKLFI